MNTSRSNEVISIAIADDHKAVRQAFKYFLSLDESLHFVFEAENGNELINQLGYHKPDILLLDIKMPDRDGLDALKFIYNNYPEIKVLMLSAFTDDVYVEQCLQFGIRGYLTKTMDIQEIAGAIKKVFKNEVYLNNLMSSQLYAKYLSSFRKDSIPSLPQFTEEEIKILNYLKDEKTTEYISQIMNLS